MFVVKQEFGGNEHPKRVCDWISWCKGMWLRILVTYDIHVVVLGFTLFIIDFMWFLKYFLLCFSHVSSISLNCYFGFRRKNHSRNPPLIKIVKYASSVEPACPILLPQWQFILCMCPTVQITLVQTLILSLDGENLK